MPNFCLKAGTRDWTAAASASAVASGMCSVLGLPPLVSEPPALGVQAASPVVRSAPAPRTHTTERVRRARGVKLSMTSSMGWAYVLADDQGAKGAVGDVETGVHEVLGATPDGVLVFHGQDAVEAALVEGVDDAAPVDIAQTRDAVAPPADVPGVRPAHGLAGVSVAVAQLGEGLDVLGLRVEHLVHVGLEGRDRVDS